MKTPARNQPGVLRRILIFVLLGYAGLAALGKAAIWIGMGIARILRDDTTEDDLPLPAIKHLRRVDGQLWAGAQPHMQQYRELSQLGIRVVIDLRTGNRTDPRPDDPEFLRSLGLEYEWLPVTDGHAPDMHTTDRFVEIVKNADGIVFMHCGGGVGRTTSLTAAYSASRNQNSALLDQMAIGPMSLEQVWFIAAISRNYSSPRPALIRWLSRYVVDAPRVLWGRATR
jgi:protein tyrosine phosphatase (PTP) superfamily phosphohydrolase (DUF442 family)